MCEQRDIVGLRSIDYQIRNRMAATLKYTDKGVLLAPYRQPTDTLGPKLGRNYRIAVTRTFLKVQTTTQLITHTFITRAAGTNFSGVGTHSITATVQLIAYCM